MTTHTENIPFPLKLYNLLELLTPKDDTEVPAIGWLRHGKSFCIFNPKKFEEEIIPEYFKHTRMSSFQRQLNLYGFRRISLTEEIRGSYYHRSFQRGRLDLLAGVRRDAVKGKDDDQFEFHSNKKQKVSQYREYLNSCSVTDKPRSAPLVRVPPPSIPLSMPSAFYTNDSPLTKLFSGGFCTTMPYPMNAQINSYVNAKNFANTQKDSNATNYVPTTSYKQSVDAVKSIEEAFKNQESYNDDFFSNQSITVPNMMNMMYHNDASSSMVQHPVPFMSVPSRMPMFSNVSMRGLPSMSMGMGMNRLNSSNVESYKRKRDDDVVSSSTTKPTQPQMMTHQPSSSWGYIDNSSGSNNVNKSVSEKETGTSSNNTTEQNYQFPHEHDDFPMLNVYDMNLLQELMEPGEGW